MQQKIYLASSWRNERQPELVRILREAGHEVYDFRNPARATTASRGARSIRTGSAGPRSSRSPRSTTLSPSSAWPSTTAACSGRTSA
jgi:hypothetical protein